MKPIATFATVLLIVSVSSPLVLAEDLPGKSRFDTLCAACHGALGKGDGAASAGLNPKPADLSNKEFMASKTDDSLKEIITKGGSAVGKSAAMPPFGASLDDKAVAEVIAYIRTFSK